MKGSIILIASFFIILLVGSVYAAESGCLTRPLATSGNPSILYACFNGFYSIPYVQDDTFGQHYPDESFPTEDWAWASNCVCQTPNLAKSDNSVCSYDYKNVADDRRYTWPVWGANKIPPGLFVNYNLGQQVNPSSCGSCRGPAVGVYGESFNSKNLLPSERLGEDIIFVGRPVQVTYLRCDTSSFTKDGSQKEYNWVTKGFSTMDLIYGSYEGGVYQCGYTFDIRKFRWSNDCLRGVCYQEDMIPVVGIIIDELDPGSKHLLDRPNMVLKSFVKTQYSNACNPTLTCPINTGCPGDFNGDNKVDAADLAYLTEFWMRADCSPENGCCGGADVAKCPGETGNTGRVDACDLAVISENFGKTCDGQPPRTGGYNPPGMPNIF